jgi:hypothetical protein
MKKSLSTILLGVSVAVMAHVSPIVWKSTELSIGQVKSNEARELTFEFTNNGPDAVRILEAKGSCGCTVVDFPKGEIKAGESAQIKASFKSAKTGQFRKTIQVKTTASAEYTNLYFTGEVVE